MPLLATLFDAGIVVEGGAGTRVIPARTFFLASLVTALRPGEIVTSVRFPLMPAGTGWAFRLFSQRHGDFAIASVAVLLGRAADGTVDRLSLALGGMAPTPLAMDDALQPFLGRLPDSSWQLAVAKAVTDRTAPEDDTRIPASYRKDLATSLITRALALRQGDAVLGEWGRLRESLIAHSTSGVDLTDSTPDGTDAWLFLDSKAYVDIKLPGQQQLDLDSGSCLDLTIEVADISAAVKPLLAKVGQLQKEVTKLKNRWQAQVNKPEKGKVVARLATDLASLYGLLQKSMKVRDQKLLTQQQVIDRMREELLRAEAQLDLLKDLFKGKLWLDPDDM